MIERRQAGYTKILKVIYKDLSLSQNSKLGTTQSTSTKASRFG